MKSIAVYSVKGGTGKTLTSKTLGYGFAKAGKRVLLCDVDGQGNTTKQFLRRTIELENDVLEYIDKDLNDRENMFIEKFMNERNEYSIARVFDEPEAIKKSIVKTELEGLDLLPAELSLYLTDTKLRLSGTIQFNKLKKANNYIKRNYDVCIYDCSPVKSLLNTNVLYAEPLVIIPVSPFDDSLQGLAMTLNEIKTTREELSLEQLDYRILIVMNHANNKACRNNVEYLRKVFGDKVLNTVIRFQAAPVERSVQRRKSIFEENSKIRIDYEDLLSELEGALYD